MLVRWFLCVALAISGLCAAPLAYAQASKAVAVSSCGTPPGGYSIGGTGYPAGGTYPITQDTTGTLCTGSAGGGGNAQSIIPLVTAGASTGSQTVTNGGVYSLRLDTFTFGGTSLAITANGTPISGSPFTSNTGFGPYQLYAGTAVVATPTGGSPSGSVTLNGGGATSSSTSSANVGATGSAVPGSANLIGGGAAGGTGNLTGATVKAASTAAAATDTGLVVTLSPNGNQATHADAIAAVPLEAQSAEPSAATTLNPVAAWADLFGKLVTSPWAPRNLQLTGFASSAVNTAITLKAAQGAGIKIYVTDLSCTRSDTGTTAIHITLNDVNSTVIDIPNNGGGGGFEEHGASPLFQIAANTAFTYTVNTATTTVNCHFAGFGGA